jgi:hypothetical protein
VDFAETALEMLLAVHKVMGLDRTRLHTSATADAELRVHFELPLPPNPLWVVTPETAQRTALEEYGRADTRSVVDRETLYVEDDTGHTLLC